MKNQVKLDSDIKISLVIEYNHYAKNNIPQIIEDIKEDYSTVETIERPTPTGDSVAEVWLKFVLETPIVEYLSENIIWDISKLIVINLFKNLISSLKKIENNSSVINIGEIDFQFDDIIIQIGGLNQNKFSIVSLVFQEIAKNINIIERKSNRKISVIQTPIYRNPYSTGNKFLFYRNDSIFIPLIEDYLRVWKIWFCDKDILFYKLNEQELIKEDNLTL